MIQIDFVELQIEVNHFNLAALVPHPAIRNRFKIGREASVRYRLYGNHCDIYYNKGILNIKSSLPYLEYGHNYCEFGPSQVQRVISKLSQCLQVNLFNACLKKVEVGFITSFLSPNLIDHLTLINPFSSFLFKGKGQIVIKHNTNVAKVYRIKDNLKKKIGNSALQKIGFDRGQVKVELVISGKKKLLKMGITSCQELIKRFDDVIQSSILELSKIEILVLNKCVDKPTLNQMLFQCFLTSCTKNDKIPSEILRQYLNNTQLSDPQKSQRRAGIRKLSKMLEEPHSIINVGKLVESSMLHQCSNKVEL